MKSGPHSAGLGSLLRVYKYVTLTRKKYFSYLDKTLQQYILYVSIKRSLLNNRDKRYV